jgi:nucleoside-diphosphate-sugar epimerase
MNPILVTGANGFVGNALVAHLRRTFSSVSAVVRNSAPYIGDKAFRIKDITGDTDWGEAVKNIHTVIHLAGRAHMVGGNQALDLYRRVNVDGTENLARQFINAGGRRFIYLSSVKVNGDRTTGHAFTEEDPPDPTDAYGQSKMEAEERLWQLKQSADFELVLIRPPLIYGPGVKANFLNMMNWLARGIPLPFGAIYNKRSLISLNNLVDLITLCVDHPSAANQLFLAADGEDLSTTDLLVRLGIAMGRPARLIQIPQRFIEQGLHLIGKKHVARKLCGSLTTDIRKAMEMLGWNPVEDVDTGLKKTAQWYLNRMKTGRSEKNL